MVAAACVPYGSERESTHPEAAHTFRKIAETRFWCICSRRAPFRPSVDSSSFCLQHGKATNAAFRVERVGRVWAPDRQFLAGIPRCTRTLGWTVLNQLKIDPATRHIPVQIVTLDEERQHGLAHGAFNDVVKAPTTDSLQLAFDRLKEFTSNRAKRLLVVEDNGIERASIVELLGHDDIDVRAVGSGAAALEAMHGGRLTASCSTGCRGRSRQLKKARRSSEVRTASGAESALPRAVAQGSYRIGASPAGRRTPRWRDPPRTAATGTLRSGAYWPSTHASAGN